MELLIPILLLYTPSERRSTSDSIQLVMLSGISDSERSRFGVGTQTPRERGAGFGLDPQAERDPVFRALGINIIVMAWRIHIVVFWDVLTSQ